MIMILLFIIIFILAQSIRSIVTNNNNNNNNNNKLIHTSHHHQYIHNNNDKNNLNNNLYNLYWIPNHAGLFSHYLQLKIIYNQIQFSQMNIIITPSSSPHYGNEIIKMCDLFDLPLRITCQNLPTNHNITCYQNMKDMIINNNTIDYCYHGSVMFHRKRTIRELVLEAVDLPPIHMIFKQKHKVFMELFHIGIKSLAFKTINNNNNDQFDMKEITKEIYQNDVIDNYNMNYTVVHWRRKDQQSTRCKQNIDISVNCKNADDLIKQIQQNTNDKIVYISTNEPDESEEMKILHQAGYLTYTTVYKEIQPYLTTTLQDISIFQRLIIEVSLMIDASTFLGWGITEINDIVEYERKLQFKQFCINQLKPINSTQETWCSKNNYTMH